MKNPILIVLLFLSYVVHAQFQDNMESYTEGEPISGWHWTDWGCGGGVGCAIMSSSFEAYSGSLSGLVPGDGTTDAVLDLGNKIFGHWRLEFWMYVPSGKEAYWNIKSCVPICPQDWGIHFFFNQNNENPGGGVILDSPIGQVNFNFPHDTWFRVYMDWDIYSGIDLATWDLSIDSVEVIPYGTPFTNGVGDIPESLGGIEFFSINMGTNLYYLDNVVFCDEFDPPGACTILGLEDIIDKNFIAYPNPVKDVLYLDFSNQKTINSIKLYDLLGRLVLEEKSNFKQLNVSHLNSGIFCMKIETDKGVLTQKFVKD